MRKKIIGLIPSRLNSKRLRKKPLLEIDGYPIIVHSYLRSKLSKKLDDLIVCTDSERIKSVIEKYGGKAVLTSKNHKNGTERIYEYSKKIKADLIIDIQGDQPLIDPKAIDKVIEFHQKNKDFDIVVPCIKANSVASSKDVVKVIFNSDNRIIYFSRGKIPFDFKDKGSDFYRDLSIISFKPKALKHYNSLKMGRLENIEGIELLRAIENGMNLGTFSIKSSSFSVDVNQDLLKAIDLMPRDKFRKKY